MAAVRELGGPRAVVAAINIANKEEEENKEPPDHLRQINIAIATAGVYRVRTKW
jgi:hypothetical protein